jgi:CheY-like chemotaxis protein
MSTALIIEDNEDNMVLISRLLKKAGYQTQWANTGQKGIDMASSQTPDFVILDIQLPDANGIDVMKQLREQFGGRLPVIIMTSHAMAGDRERFKAEGCSEYIEKPIDPENVVEQIRKAIGDSLS